jgi:putative colanic acid biosynthesis acetyltransferase WcaF
MNAQKTYIENQDASVQPMAIYSKKGTDLARFDRSSYSEGPRWKLAVWYLINHSVFHSSLPWPSGFKVWILRLFGGKIGKNVVIKQNVRIKNAWKLSIGDNSWLGEGTWIENLEDVIIGKNVCISQNAMILTGNHDYTESDFRFRLAKIHIDEGSWIGAHSLVCPGVRCKSHSVLTVNSVATKDLEAWHIYSGNPALPVRVRKMKF